MKLAAQVAEPALEIVGVDDELARQAEKREVIAVAPEREDAAALRAEMVVDRRARAAVTTFENRD